MGKNEILAACFAYDTWIGAIAGHIPGSHLPQAVKGIVGAGEVDPGHVAV